MTEVAILYDPIMREHAPDGYDPRHPEWTEMVKRRLGDNDEGGMKFTHPERPERLEAVLESLERDPIQELIWPTPQPAARETLGLVHTEQHLEFIESHRGRSGWLHHDTTAVSEGSVAAAEMAAGCACAAVDEAVLMGRRSFALCRPPGHHAHADKARGFCLYNNVAIAVRHAQATHGVERALVVDWDAHHGNGTQAILRDDPDVMHFDMHAASPVYPGSGPVFDTGSGPNRGTVINVPLPPKTGDGPMIEALDDILVPAAFRFRPDLVIVSAGFDGHASDLLLDQSEEGFAQMTSRLVALAEVLADGRIAFVLEGGYRDSLSVCVRTCLNVLAGAEPDEVPLGLDDPGRDDLRLAASFHNRPVYW